MLNLCASGRLDFKTFQSCQKKSATSTPKKASLPYRRLSNRTMWRTKWGWMWWYGLSSSRANLVEGGDFLLRLNAKLCKDFWNGQDLALGRNQIMPHMLSKYQSSWPGDWLIDFILLGCSRLITQLCPVATISVTSCPLASALSSAFYLHYVQWHPWKETYFVCVFVPHVGFAVCV
jgi:hypothetical protein